MPKNQFGTFSKHVNGFFKVFRIGIKSSAFDRENSGYTHSFREFKIGSLTAEIGQFEVCQNFRRNPYRFCSGFFEKSQNGSYENHGSDGPSPRRDNIFAAASLSLRMCHMRVFWITLDSESVELISDLSD